MAKHPDDEISAYLDGECRRPARLEAHLRQCPRCAARLAELRQMAATFRRLAPPPVRDGFSERVVAAAAASQRRTVMPLLRWAPVAVAACGVIVLIAFSATRLEPPARALLVDEAQVAYILAQRPDWAEAIEMTPDMFDALDMEPQEIPDDAVAGLADVELALQDACEPLPSDQPVEDLVETMNAAELAAFKQLLREYPEEA